MPTTFVSWRCFFLHWLVVKTPPKDAFRALLFFFQYSTAGLQLCNKMHLLILLISFNRMRHLYHKIFYLFGTMEWFFVRNIYFRTNFQKDLPRTEVSSGSNQMWHKDSYWGLRKIRKHRPRWHLGSSSFFSPIFCGIQFHRKKKRHKNQRRVWPQKWRLGFLDGFSLLMKWF